MLEDAGATTPVYRQIYEGLRDRVLSGRLAAGERLPSSRALALDLGVSRTTVLSAYNQLIAEGYFETRERAGTFVSASVPDWITRPGPASPWSAEERPPWAGTLSSRAEALSGLPFPPPRRGDRRYGIDFRHGEPHRSDFPTRIWAGLVYERSRRATHHRSPPEGIPELRESIVRYLDRVRGVLCDSSQVIVTAGSQHALYAISRTIAEEGDRAVIEEPHYQGVIQAVVAAGLAPTPVAVDRHGLVPARLPRPAPRTPLLFASPAHQFPLGGVLPLTRRLALLRWASEVGATVVEDDYDSEYRYEGRPIATLMSLDRESRVIYVGTFSKTLSPWVRLGFLVAPEPLIEPLRRMVWATHRFIDPVPQEALAELLEGGHFERNLRRVRRAHTARRDRLIAACEASLGDRIELWGRETGGHMVGWLPGLDRAAIETLTERAATLDLGLSSMRDYYLTPPNREGLMLKYASMTVGEIGEGVRRLTDALGESGA